MSTIDFSTRIAEEAHILNWFRTAGETVAKLHWDGQTLLVLDGKGGGARHDRETLRICGALPAASLPAYMIWLLAELYRVNGVPAAAKPAPVGVGEWILTVIGFPDQVIDGPLAARMVNELSHIPGAGELAA